MRRLVVLVALPLLLGAGKPANTAAFFSFQTTYQRSSVIEQESPGFPDCGSTCVVYPPAPFWCAWDVDDGDEMTGTGDVPSEVTATLCVVADGYEGFGGDNHRVTATVVSSKPNLVVWITNDQGQTIPLPPTTANHQTTYTTSFFDLTGYPYGPYPVIPDSNGGTGILVNYTLHVAPLDRTARSVYIFFETGPEGDTHWGCP